MGIVSNGKIACALFNVCILLTAHDCVSLLFLFVNEHATPSPTLCEERPRTQILYTLKLLLVLMMQGKSDQVKTPSDRTGTKVYMHAGNTND
jgi:hypothetical protein